MEYREDTDTIDVTITGEMAGPMEDAMGTSLLLLGMKAMSKLTGVDPEGIALESDDIDKRQPVQTASRDMKFDDSGITRILDGSKRMTVRIAEEWGDVKRGMVINAIGKDGKMHAILRVTGNELMTFYESYDKVQKSEKHKSYGSYSEYIGTMSSYYGMDVVDDKTMMNLIEFEVLVKE